MAKENSPFTPGIPVPIDYFIGRTREIERINRAIVQTSRGRNENLFLTGKGQYIGSQKGSIHRLLSFADLGSIHRTPF
uniref:Uncharacterized protein n=1 Tax=Candidatus Methanogaster sp. ANME-2c ERB4 TaxID=2759911 RepID=A0A7G9YN34_9EURY|nr:hypothetical protein HONBAIEO_00023 [Methanosarcinales archaeon ANME-2c ERB4]QNO49418.1 hypothetical protein JHKIABMC_00024 [Methanosarcinales archaeon ANME-2c ERB4]